MMQNSSRRSYSHLLYVVLAGIICNLLSFIFPVPIPQAGQRPNRFVIAGLAPRSGGTNLFFDYGYNIFPGESSHADMTGASASEWRTGIFPLPPGALYRLRFDPIYADKVSYWKDARIEDSKGRIVHRFVPSDFEPMNQIAAPAEENGSIKIVPTVGAFNPMVTLRLPAALKLEDKSAENCRIQKPLLRIERVVAVCFGFGGLFFMNLIISRRNRDSKIGRSAPSRWLETGALIFAALSIVYFRRPSLFIAPQMFIEDGMIFFFSQWSSGWKSVVMPYAGYLHLIPRLTAGLSQYFPIAWTPRIFGIVALLSILATVLKSASARVGFPFVYWCTLATLCVPNSDEITAFLTNVQWWGAVVLLLVGISAPARTWGELTRDILAAFLVGLSGPWAILFAPIFVARLCRQFSRGSFATLLVLLISGAIQLHFNQTKLPDLNARYLNGHAMLSVAGLGYRLGGQLIGYLPDYYSVYADAITTHIKVLPWEIWALIAWVLLICATPVPRPYRRIRYAFVFAAICLAVSTILRTNGWEYALFSLPVCQRYVFLPLLISIWLLIMALEGSKGGRWFAVSILALIAIRNVDYFRMPSTVDFHWAQYASSLPEGKATVVPIYPAGWNMRIDAKHR